MEHEAISFSIDLPSGIPTHYDNHLGRRLSAMKGQFLDLEAFDTAVGDGDPILYEVYEISRPAVSGELIHGISILYPGKIGAEYYMTKGHFHTVLDTAEIYYCLQGQGVMVMETPEGDWRVERLLPGAVLYVPPRWAHRSVNTGHEEALISLFAYPGNAGHDYGTIESQGYRKLIVETDGQMQIIDNPRWKSPSEREGNG
ncbi:MAG: glucose-6-phosphate isomerase [Chloroflexota bacterium]|jgi:glucose-6-phosphate isomerase